EAASAPLPNALSPRPASGSLNRFETKSTCTSALVSCRRGSNTNGSVPATAADEEMPNVALASQLVVVAATTPRIDPAVGPGITAPAIVACALALAPVTDAFTRRVDTPPVVGGLPGVRIVPVMKSGLAGLFPAPAAGS